jgi:hypothetical protein
MDQLHRDVMTAFGHGNRPRENELVVWDGFDEPEKERAVSFYGGKSWEDVLGYLRRLKDEPLFRAAYYLEEWSVLSPPALAYYARAHLEFLSETLTTAQPDREFVFHLLGQLHQVAYMHKGSPFSPVQTDLLRRVAQRVSAKAAVPGAFEEFTEDIRESADRVLREMQARSG